MLVTSMTSESIRVDGEAPVAVEPGPLDTEVASLTRRLAAGEEDAFRAFHTRYFDRLTRFLLMVARGDPEQVQEALQATLIRVVRRVREFETEAAFWSWLKVVAHNSARDLGRKQTRYRGLLERLAAAWTSPVEESVPEDRPIASWLEEGLEDLDPDDRALLEQKYTVGRSVRELAAQAGVTEKAIEARLFRLRRDLRERVLRKAGCI